jgi:hypothetical protein
MSDFSCPLCTAKSAQEILPGSTPYADSRDIEVKVMNVTAPCSAALRQFEGKYKLQRYRGPIASVIVQCDDNFFIILVGIHVLDAANGEPIHLTVEKTYPRWMLEGDLRGTKGFFEQCLRQALQWTHNHELDESFVCEGKFVTDPHPEEVRSFRPLPPPIRTGNFARDAMANNRGIHTNS